ncbi:MAG: hypothetical protein MRECE_35c010 [Mycoplasmataceae bacterium CE_OT135]|nr:MAG: hypothetical protein MRECE_35c010 [Mycoplasmataceae bacterium CE_OT135]
MARPAQKLNSKKSLVGGSLNQPRKINCFYKCPFATSESPLMEKHYRKEHYQKEAIRG